jgi:DNA-binding NtrC family response regulator
MPARIVLVHDDLAVLEEIAAALRAAGHEVATFSGSMEALDALEDAETVQLLITRVGFPRGTPNGLALARMARFKRPAIKVLFAARPEMEEHTAGLGEFLAAPINIPQLVECATRLLEDEQGGVVLRPAALKSG